jgi:hypothetical protein
VKINNVVSVISYSDFIPIGLVGWAGSHSEDWLASLARREGSDRSHGVFVAERSNLDGDGKTRSKGAGQLGLVN